ncbi:MAG: helix-turn-helix transcriptional regulator [Clostridia bacterium]|nr:helix-turn-helix transcriptional regulator [Clostridia bacterium]
MARIIDGTEMNLIGDNVKKYRKLRKMSQQELSNKMELMGVYVCRGSVSRIEDRSRTVTDIELYALATVLEVSVNDLLNQKELEEKYK